MIFSSSDTHDQGLERSERTDREETELQLKVRSRSQIIGGTKTGFTQLTGWKKMWQQVKCKQSATRELKKLKQNAKKLEGKPFSSTDHEEFKDKCMSPERNPVTGGVHIFLWFKTPTPSSCFNT